MSKNQKIDFHPDEEWDPADVEVPIISPDLIWQAIDVSAVALLKRNEMLKRVEAGIKLKRQERHDLFKNLSKVQSSEQLLKYINKLFHSELTEKSEIVDSSEIDLESLDDIDDDEESLATIQSENETSESEVNYRHNKPIKVYDKIKPLVSKKPSMPKNMTNLLDAMGS